MAVHAEPPYMARRLLKQAQQHQALYMERLRCGVCPRCGGRRDGEWLTCLRCLLANRARRKQTDTPDKQHVYSRNLYQRRCREGRCPGCGMGRDSDTIHCTRCLARRKVQLARNAPRLLPREKGERA